MHSSPNGGQPLDPERITRQYQQLQYCNYITYVTLMEQATGQTYKLDPGMGVNASLFPAQSSSHIQRIEGIPPGRPAGTISHAVEETYGQYKKRTDPNYTVLARSEYHDPRNGKNQFERKYDSKTEKKASPAAQDDWDDDGPPEPKKNKAAEPDDDGWNDFLPNQSKADDSISKAETKPLVSNDEWGDEEKVPASSTPKQSDNNGWSDDEGKTNSFGSGYGSSNNRESSYSSRGSTGGYRGSRQNSRGGRDGGDRTPQEGEWSCTQCKANNYRHRVECFRCKEPKGDAQAATTSGGGYQGSRDNSRGGFRGGYRGGSRGGYNNQSRGRDFRSHDAKPVKSGWSDEEGEKEDESKPEVVMPSGGDDWDVEEPKAVMKRPADNDDTGDVKPPSAKKPAKEKEDSWDFEDDKKVEIKAAADDDWAEFTAPAKVDKKKKREKSDKKRKSGQPAADSHAAITSVAQFGNVNDDLDIFEANSSEKSKSGTTNDDDDWGV